MCKKTLAFYSQITEQITAKLPNNFMKNAHLLAVIVFLMLSSRRNRICAELEYRKRIADQLHVRFTRSSLEVLSVFTLNSNYELALSISFGTDGYAVFSMHNA